MDEKITIDEFYDEFKQIISDLYDNNGIHSVNSSFLQYAGGKFYLANWIIPFFPSHNTYVEPFGGSAQVLFRKKLSKVEVYNDIDNLLVSLFKCIRNNPKELFERLYFIQFSRSEFDLIKKRFVAGQFEDELDKAVCYFIVNRMCFSGKMNNPTFIYVVKSNRNKLPKAYYNKIEGLINFSYRLRNVIIENQDFTDLINRYDSENTFFYVDPPYVDIDYYKYNFKKEDHRKLHDLLTHIKGKFLLSYNYDNYILDLYQNNGFTIITKDFPTFMSYDKNETSKEKRNELLIMNYDINKIRKFSGKNNLTLDKFLIK